MSLVAYGNGTATAADPIENNGFWPAIDPAAFRDQHRIDTTITPVSYTHLRAHET